MIQRDSTDESVALSLQQERLERAAKTQRLRELRLARDAATKDAKPSAAETLIARRAKRVAAPAKRGRKPKSTA